MAGDDAEGLEQIPFKPQAAGEPGGFFLALGCRGARLLPSRTVKSKPLAGGRHLTEARSLFVEPLSVLASELATLVRSSGLPQSVTRSRTVKSRPFGAQKASLVRGCGCLRIEDVRFFSVGGISPGRSVISLICPGGVAW